MEHLTIEQLTEQYKNGNIRGFETTEGKKIRLFTSTDGTLCAYNRGSSRYGYKLAEMHLRNFKKYINKRGADNLTKEQQEYKIIHKYLAYAEKASFTNDWLDKCLELPQTYNEWVEQGKKSIYELGITTGNGIDGKVITVNGIEKEYPLVAQRIREAIKEGKDYHASRYRFRGYDMTVEIKYFPETGEIKGWLSMEYLNCGNGYYYMLINENAFIGYDVD